MEAAAAQEQPTDPNHNPMLKGRPRTKRPRTPSSPLTVTAVSDQGAKINGGFTTSSSITSSADWDRARSASEHSAPTDEEQDMANCLILLAQGTTTNCTPPPQAAQPQKQPAIFYECKTCNRSFPSFQALGGHRVSHKRPKLPQELPPQLAPLPLLPDHYDHDDSPSLSLRIATEADQRIKVSTSSKAHECTICGSGFLTGQALGGHMRRHRAIPAGSGRGEDDIGGNKMRNLLGLDLNLPAPDEEDQNRDREQDKFVFGSNDKTQLVFSSASPLVDCHY